MPDSATAAERMVRSQLRGRDVRDERVLAAMQHVPRHRFVPEVDMERAYGDHALPTAEGQTISQPYIVAKMTELLAVEPGMNVLEVGGGSGYQAAVLAQLGARVVSMERYASLARQAERTVRAIMPEASVQFVVGDGTLGYPLAAPFDRILITAATPKVPAPLDEQLADPGRVVAPIGDSAQQWLTVRRREGGALTERAVLACRFVPLLGAHGFREV